MKQYIERRPTANAHHPLVGTWFEQGEASETTSVVYTISARGGQFHVSGVDESDGVELEISEVAWDGKNLRFVTRYPPNNWTASHEFSLNRTG
jgi:hypothetical protein